MDARHQVVHRTDGGETQHDYTRIYRSILKSILFSHTSRATHFVRHYRQQFSRADAVNAIRLHTTPGSATRTSSMCHRPTPKFSITPWSCRYYLHRRQQHSISRPRRLVCFNFGRPPSGYTSRRVGRRCNSTFPYCTDAIGIPRHHDGVRPAGSPPPKHCSHTLLNSSV